MPRFGDRPHLPPPPQPTDPILSVTKGDQTLVSLDQGDLQRIGVVDIVADFHCVTTWSVREVRWTGVPFRLVAPDLYGYKSMKHLIRLDFTIEPLRRLGKEHPRGRVAFEERHPVYPSWLVKPLYRMLIPMTAAIAARSASRIESTSKAFRTS